MYGSENAIKRKAVNLKKLAEWGVTQLADYSSDTLVSHFLAYLSLEIALKNCSPEAQAVLKNSILRIALSDPWHYTT